MNEPATVRVAQGDGRPPRQAALYWLALDAFAIGTEGFMIFYDFCRVENDMIVEHWDVIEEIPPVDQWKNKNGKV